jgi:hypothetical protein
MRTGLLSLPHTLWSASARASPIGIKLSLYSEITPSPILPLDGGGGEILYTH